ncbi:MAG: glycosyltransferase [Bdellovibrionales bacterium]|nr:glycosyltransferase [Bdellovibrionales bacterium]
MADEQKLSKLMRDDWNRRVDHDYRFWMSDGYSSDEAMWESGRRDFSIISKDISALREKRVLELGCGVGRMLRAASEECSEVVGIDVSDVALTKAEELLSDRENITLVQGNGIDLHPLEDNSFDLVYSFAALSSVPAQIIARYLHEMQRVVKPNGVVRLQLYLGTEQLVGAEDTLHVRCFEQSRFSRAAESAGFHIDCIEDLILPFQVSFEEVGICAKVVSLRKFDQPQVAHDQTALILLSSPEGEMPEAVTGVDVECWMSLNYAQELAEKGETLLARKALEYAASHTNTAAIDVRDLMERIVQKIEANERVAQTREPRLARSEKGEIWERNLRALSESFPELIECASSCEDASCEAIEVRDTEEGPSLFYRGQSLDHPTKPVKAGQTWLRNNRGQIESGDCEKIVVVGLSLGYHIESLLEAYGPEISVVVIEPDEEVFKISLRKRDFSKIFSRVSKLIVGQPQHFDFFSGKTELIIRPQTQALNETLCQTLRSRFYGARGLAMIHPSIGVLGPIMGGTLPILGYTSHALAQLGQRIRPIDMSGFKGGFNELDGFVKDEIRQALVRGKYTEMLSEVILESVNEKPIDILICMAQAPISAKALTELRNRGVITVLWFVEDYLRFHSWRYMAPYYDFIFTIQRGDCLTALKAAGAGETHYLPVACDPAVHAPLRLTEDEKKRWGSPVSFVGAGYHNRQQMFASLAELPFKIWGTEWPECKPFDGMVQEKGRRLTPEEYVKIFNATTININLHSSTERDGVDPNGDFVNPRTFELASCGAFQLVDERSLLTECFEPGKEVVTFHSRADLVEKIHYYLKHDDERAKIARAGQERVLRDHTYHSRLREMLSFIYSSKFEQLKRRQEASPWSKLLRRSKVNEELHKRCTVAFERGEEPNLDGLVSDIVTGQGKLSETEKKLLFLFHVRKQMIRMRQEERGGS